MSPDSPSAGLDPALPLVVDLDGTLLRSDMLIETFSALLASRPLSALRTLLALRHGIAAFKAAVAAAVTVELERLPWNAPLIARLTSEKAAGRLLYLASASDRRLVQRVADYFGLFDGIFASDGVVNLRSARKAEALVASFGSAGFAYAGNSRADLAVWQAAGEILVVNAPAAIQRAARDRWQAVEIIGEERLDVALIARAMRPHQWAKNFLLAVPALAGHRFDIGTAAAVMLAFLSFSLCASGVYVLNDLIDLDRDRRHRSKRRRPFASGDLSVLTGVVLIPILFGVAFLLALPIGLGFLGVLAGYFVLTLGYSLKLKREMMLDVVALACLYGVRLVAGGEAAGVPLSHWLAGFSIFLFCALALVKRCAELVGQRTEGQPERSGRAYRADDLPMLEALAAASGFTSVLVFALYAASPAVAVLYTNPGRLWLLCVLLVYWIGRVLLLTHRGEMHDDPVVFAITDRNSLMAVMVAFLIVLASL